MYCRYTRRKGYVTDVCSCKWQQLRYQAAEFDIIHRGTQDRSPIINAVFGRLACPSISFRCHWGQGEVDALTTKAEVCVGCLHRECVIVHSHFSIAGVSKGAQYSKGKSDTEVSSPKFYDMWILAFQFSVILPCRIITSMQ